MKVNSAKILLILTLAIIVAFLFITVSFVFAGNAKAPDKSQKVGAVIAPAVSPEVKHSPVPSPAEVTPVLSPSPSDTPAEPGTLWKKDEEPPPSWDTDKSGELPLGQDPDRGKPRINIAMTILSLTVVCIIAWGVLKLYSGFSGAGTSLPSGRKKLMKIKERHVIGPNKQLCLVELPGKVVLMGISETDMKILTEIDPKKIEEIEGLEERDKPEKLDGSSYLADVLVKRWQKGAGTKSDG